MKRKINAIFRKFGYQITRLKDGDSPQPADAFKTNAIGMETTLRGLKHRGFEPTPVLDIGAAVGEWTRLCLKYFPNARYYLIEPMIERKNDLKAWSISTCKGL